MALIIFHTTESMALKIKTYMYMYIQSSFSGLKNNRINSFFNLKNCICVVIFWMECGLTFFNLECGRGIKECGWATSGCSGTAQCVEPAALGREGGREGGRERQQWSTSKSREEGKERLRVHKLNYNVHFHHQQAGATVLTPQTLLSDSNPTSSYHL